MSARGREPLLDHDKPPTGGRHATPIDGNWRAPLKKRKPQVPDTIVFVTTGDQSQRAPFHAAAKVFSDQRSNSSNRIIEVATVQEATKKLEELQPSSLKRVVFVGHGLAPRGQRGRLNPETDSLETRLLREGPGFIFHGRRFGNGMEDFTWTSTDSVLWASSAHPPSVAFLAALSQKLAPEAHVYLQCCFSGMDGTAGSLVKRVATAIAKPTNKRVLVSGYTTDLLYHGITNGKNSRVLGYGTSLPNQTVTPLSEIPGFVTNKPGMAPHDAVMEALVPGP